MKRYSYGTNQPKSALKPAIIGAILLFTGISSYFYFHSGTNEPKVDESISPTPTAAGHVFGTIDLSNFGTLKTTSNKKWFLLGDEINNSDQTLTYSLTLTDNQQEVLSGRSLNVSYHINNTNVTGEMIPVQGQDGTYQVQVSLSQLSPSEYTIQAQLKTGEQVIESLPTQLNVSYPVYVAWTLDWEGYDVKDEYLQNIEELTAKHNSMPLTHFFNPRLYTNTTISTQRQEYLTQWVLQRNQKQGDAIELHLHMFPDMVKAAGVTPKSNPIQWGSTLHDGYDILTMQYSYDELVTIMNWSKSIFAEKGLPTPTIFRAGGWYANEDTLKAAQASGFLADSSGRTAYSFGTNKVDGPWNLSETTQPYRLNEDDQNNTSRPTMSLWEFPNNGADSWMFTEAQMKDRFNANYSGKIATDKKLVTYLSHPEWFKTDKPRIDALFTYTDQFLNDKDNGPVVYITLAQAYRIWQ
ncbi:hypothetical protein HGA91_05965 [candidate division WWE3 bacterium]|nr:hypothetical protein [candidate division WWE3 bacterium]